MSQATFTLDQVREKFFFDYGDAHKRDTVETLRENVSIDDAAEIVVSIGQALEACKDPKDAATAAAWTPAERLFWYVRESYIKGVVEGLSKAAAANNEALAEMEAATRQEVYTR